MNSPFTFSCGYQSNDKQFVLPTLLLSAMGFIGGYFIICSALHDPAPDTTIKKILAYSFVLIWVGVIGGVALLLIAGFVFLQRLFFECSDDALRWRNTMLRGARTLPSNQLRRYQWMFYGEHPALALWDDAGKKYTIRSTAYLTQEQVSIVDEQLTAICSRNHPRESHEHSQRHHQS